MYIFSFVGKKIVFSISFIIKWFITVEDDVCQNLPFCLFSFAPLVSQTLNEHTVFCKAVESKFIGNNFLKNTLRFFITLMLSDKNWVDLDVPLLLNNFGFLPLSKRNFSLCNCHRIEAGRKLKWNITQLDFVPVSPAELSSSRILAQVA